jgi:plastocyanin
MRFPCALAAVLLVIVPALLAGCGPPPAPVLPVSPPPTTRTEAAGSPEAAAAQVVIDNFAYSPREITVTAGTRVTWVNHDDSPHTVTSTAKPKAFDSGAMDTDASFAFTFAAPGTYEYFCAVHPHMTGKVIVK